MVAVTLAVGMTVVVLGLFGLLLSDPGRQRPRQAPPTRRSRRR
jgi:hypothetical protein